ncbi:MAG: DUF3943 domain-containing protein [Mucilaginibacter sp.]
MRTLYYAPKAGGTIAIPGKFVYQITIAALLILLSQAVFAQTSPLWYASYHKVSKAEIDSVFPAKDRLSQIDTIKPEAVKAANATTNRKEQPETWFADSLPRNKYGDLLNDDKRYNLRYPLWKPAVEVVGINAAIWSLDRFILNANFSHIGPSTWGHNIHTGWEWDDDRFGINFVGHPYSGTLYFNAARSQGYTYLQSIPFAAFGSSMWEYFGENTLPSYNDLINTTFNGEFLGEIFYRLSSNILDDRTYGSERFFRELAAGLVDPTRELNRLLQGKAFRHTQGEVYQKEPINVTLSIGQHKINEDNKTFFGKGPTNLMVNAQFDYGDPFEDIYRKPFDYFRIKTEFSFGVGRKILDNILGYGNLLSGNAKWGDLSVLYGAFQYYDYWDNRTFELGALGLGGGLITKYDISKDVSIFTNLHLAGIPLAGNSTRFGPDTSQVRDYTYNDGMEAKFETTLNLGKYVDAGLSFYYYILHTFVGPPGNNYVGVLRPRISVHLYKGLSVGFEDFQYYDDRYLKNYPAIYSVRSEQKIFLTWFFEDHRLRGKTTIGNQ